MVIMATAHLQPVNDSGVAAELTLYESEDGSTLTVFGIATGMHLLGQYLSLACDLGSNSDLLPPCTPPGPCMPSRAVPEKSPPENLIGGDLAFHLTPMGTLLGLWQGALGAKFGAKRTLQIVRPVSELFGMHLYEMNTVSIRRSATRLGRDPNHDVLTRRFPLVACGDILRVP